MKKYLDFDKIDKIFYINYYLEDIGLSIKIPIKILKERDIRMRIEKFAIKNSVYLTDF